MSDHIRIGDIRPRIQYLGNGAVKTFSFPFPIFAESDLTVFRDAEPCLDGFDVNGAGESGGGGVTFDAPPPAGSVITLARAVPIARTTDFQDGGTFRAGVINEELDRLVCMAQQLREELERTVRRAPTSVSTGALTLPDPVPGRALKFAADGALIASSGDPDGAQLAASGHAEAAEAARAAAEAARDQMLALYDEFDDRYLGVKSVDPATDNDGNPLFPGALYFRQSEPDGPGAMMVYTGVAWVAAYVAGDSVLTTSNLVATISAFAPADKAAARAGLDAASVVDADALRDVAPQAKSSAYVLAPVDRGRSVDTVADVAVPADAAAPFPVGAVVTVTNLGPAAIAISPQAGVTLRQAGTANAGVRTLLGYGIATLRKVAAETWFVAGAGLS